VGRPRRVRRAARGRTVQCRRLAAARRILLWHNSQAPSGDPTSRAATPVGRG
jgi:hypothetical protein